MSIRILDAPESPWGDYGTIAVHGMTAHLGRDSAGALQLGTARRCEDAPRQERGVALENDSLERALGKAGLLSAKR